MTDALVAVLSVVLFPAFLALWSSCSAPAARRAVHDGHPTDDPQAGVRFTFLGTSRSSSADPPSRRVRRGPRGPNRRRDSYLRLSDASDRLDEACLPFAACSLAIPVDAPAAANGSRRTRPAAHIAARTSIPPGGRRRPRRSGACWRGSAARAAPSAERRAHRELASGDILRP